MAIIPEIFALEKRLDAFIASADNVDDLYLQSHLARYLAILTSGYFEKVMHHSIRDYCAKRCKPEITKYVSRKIAWEGSINRSKLKKILDDFDDSLYLYIENSTGDTAKSALDSIKDLRDKLAHGEENGTSYRIIKDYHTAVRKYAHAIKSTLCR